MSINKYNAERYYDPTAYEALTSIEKMDNSAKHKSGKSRDRQRENRKAKNSQPTRQTYRPLVYICSPYAADIKTNTENTSRYCRFAISKQVIPIAPHLLFPQFLDDRDTNERELGLFMGLVLLSKCKEVWIFGSYISNGMKAEIEKAKKLNTPVRYFDEYCSEVKPK